MKLIYTLILLSFLISTPALSIEKFHLDIKVSNITDHLGKPDFITVGRAYWFTPYVFIVCNTEDNWEDECYSDKSIEELKNYNIRAVKSMLEDIGK